MGYRQILHFTLYVLVYYYLKGGESNTNTHTEFLSADSLLCCPTPPMNCLQGLGLSQGQIQQSGTQSKFPACGGKDSTTGAAPRICISRKLDQGLEPGVRSRREKELKPSTAILNDTGVPSSDTTVPSTPPPVSF